MRKHFLSVLGTGEYSNVIYNYGNISYETAYVQEALLKLKFEGWEQGDRITIFLTEEAKNKNWKDRPYTEREKETAEKSGKILPEIRTGLERILQEEYKNYLDNVEECMIPIGANEEELWTIFQVIFGRIREEECLYIDITHSLRNIPIQMLAVIAYARTIKNIQVGGIYYGAFEMGKKNTDGITEAPVLDLISFLDILDWSQAANAFVKYGNSDHIYDLYMEQKKMDRGRTKQDELYKVLVQLHYLTRELETGRGYYNPEGRSPDGTSIEGTYKKYKIAYQNLQDADAGVGENEKKQKNIIEPLGELLQVIDQKISTFDVDSNLETGLVAVQWAIDNKRTQQGFTALEETIKTFLCNYYGFAEVKEDSREGICKRICSSLGRTLMRKEVEALTPELRQQGFKRWAEDREAEEGILEKAERMFLTVPEELIILCGDITNFRNSLNHFGYSNSGQFTSVQLDAGLEKLYKRFLNIMQMMRERQIVE